MAIRTSKTEQAITRKSGLGGVPFFILCLVIAFAIELPGALWWLGIETIQPPMFLGILNTGFSYMATFFHEIGHTVFSWIFGYPALPIFDFVFGGGMSLTLERSLYVQGGAFVLAGLGLGCLYKIGEYDLLKYAVPLFVLYIAAAFTRFNEAVPIYMGTGMEILIAGFCIFRAATRTAKNELERYLNMIFGIFIILKNGVMDYALFTDDVARTVYKGFKGDIQEDFDRLADMFFTTIPGVAVFSVLLMAAVMALTLWLVRVHEKQLA